MGWLRPVWERIFGRPKTVPEQPGAALAFDQFPQLRPMLVQGAITAADEAIAGFAYLHFSDGAGRGVVWLSQTIGRCGDDVITALREMIYIPQDRLQQLLGNPENPLLEMVRRYDPETEVLIVVHQDQQSQFSIPLKPTVPLSQSGKALREFIQTANRQELADEAPFGHAAALFFQSQSL